MHFKSKRSKACAITPKVKAAVYKRDRGHCVYCGQPGLPEAHFISRAKGGLGIEENILTVCRPCHNRMDNSTDRGLMLKIAEAYLREHYPDWDKGKLIYNKYSF